MQFHQLVKKEKKANGNQMKIYQRGMHLKVGHLQDRTSIHKAHLLQITIFSITEKHTRTRYERGLNRRSIEPYY